jgi:hypothetical protein
MPAGGFGGRGRCRAGVCLSAPGWPPQQGSVDKPASSDRSMLYRLRFQLRLRHLTCLRQVSLHRNASDRSQSILRGLPTDAEY